MKKISKFCLLCSSAAILSSCVPDMDLNNPSQLSVDTYYKTAAQLELAVIPAYQCLISFNGVEGGYGRGAYYYLLLPGDDFDHTFKCVGEELYPDTYSTPPNQGNITSGWKGYFEGVYASNTAIEKISNFTGEISESVKNRLLGEAYFLRGLHYMHLCAMFGETIPLVDHPAQNQSDYYPTNAKAGEIYALIINDFKKASELLPLRSELYANVANKGRATKGTAQAYLAKAYMYRPILEKGKTAEFDKAAPLLKAVIDSKEYKLMDNFRANGLGGDYENNDESVFEVQMFNGTSWLGGDNSDSWKWQEIGVPDGTGSSWWNIAPNKKTYDEFEDGDPRRYMTLWCPGGAKYTELSGNVADWNYMMAHLSSDNDLYGTRKECPDYQIADIDDDVNTRLMRYSDVLLMYAECLSETGNDSKAITDPTGPKYYIQQVRDRANKVVPSEQPHLWYQHSPGTIPNVDQLLSSGKVINGVAMNSIKNIIEHERYVEFCGEYLRYFDLLRWGMADAKWLEPLKTLGWSEKAMYFPFPQSELNNNPNLKGNDMN